MSDWVTCSVLKLYHSMPILCVLSFVAFFFFSLAHALYPEGIHQGVSIADLHIGDDAIPLAPSPRRENGTTSVGLWRVIVPDRVYKAFSFPRSRYPILQRRVVE